jgi:CBS domain containing-hemolysin-like protein
MSDQSEQIKKNFLEQWIRLAFVLLYIVVFGILWDLIAIVILVVIILQSIYRVFAVENNSHLFTFSEGLTNFLWKILRYVLYLSDEKPIDFDAFFTKEPASKNTSADAEVYEEDEAEMPSSGRKRNDADDDVLADISFTRVDDDDADDDQDKKPD